MMSRCRRPFLLFVILSVLFVNVPQGIQAQSTQPKPHLDRVVASFPAGEQSAQLGVLPASPQAEASSPGVEPDGPQALLYEQGAFSILDTLNQRILRYDLQTRQPQPVALPAGYYANLREQGGDLLLYDTANEQVALLKSGSVTVQALPSPQAALGIAPPPETTPPPEAAPAPSSPLAAYFAQGALAGELRAETGRIDDHHARFSIFDSQDVLLATLAVATGHTLGAARFLGQDDNGNFYLQVEEVLEDVPALIAETTIRRYSPDAHYLDAARLPLEAADFLPNRPVALDPQGGAYFLLVKHNETQIVALGFNPQVPSQLAQRWQALAALPQFQDPAAAAGGDPDAVMLGASSITRQQVIQAAAAYLNASWTLSSANYHTGQANNWDNCSTETIKRENWRLPRYLTGRMNQVIQEVPYTWGGYQSIATFKTKLSQGSWAGNICGQETLGNVAGVDCSGFISQVLSLGGHYTTATLPNVAHRINWNDLRPGDFLLNGGHVMLFDKFDNGRTADGGVWVYESTMKNNWDRVVYDKVDYSYLTKYSYASWRANNIVEDAPPVSQNLVRNGDFATNLDQWSFFGEINYTYRDGALYASRYANGSGASVFQDINYPLEQNYPMEISFSLGNYSAVEKTFSLNLRSSDTWIGALGCTFTVPPGTDMKTYRTAGKVPARWANARIEFTLTSIDSQPNLIADNISVKYRPDLNPSGIECAQSDPPPAYTTFLNHNLTGSGWVKVDTQNTVYCSKNQGNLVYNQTGRGLDNGAAQWWITVPADGSYEVFAFMPSYTHAMNVTPHSRYWVEYEGMPSGGPSQLVVLDQTQNLCSWVSLGTYHYVPGKTYGVYMGNANIPSSVAVPDLLAADQVMVVPVGNPDRSGPSGGLTAPANGSTLIRALPATTLDLQASATDNSSGVASVEFHALYNGAWHSIGTDYTAPYAMTWAIPADIAPQTLTFTIHVLDRSGNETRDPGGYRTVNYQMGYRSTGYDVSKNGYSFRNFGDLNPLDFTYMDFANMVGADKVCNWIAGICFHTHEGDAAYDVLYNMMSGGRCAGMSVTNQMFFKGMDFPWNYQPFASNPSDLSGSNILVRRFISWYQVRQVYPPVGNYLKKGVFGTPVVELYKLYDYFSTPNGDLPILTLEGANGKHAVTPYAIEDKGSGVYWVRIYDSNYPGDTQKYVIVNTQTNAWSYPPYAWSGDAASRTLGVIPMALFFSPVTIAQASDQAPFMRQLATGETGVTLWVSGTDQVMVTDSSGRRLGNHGGQFNDEIPEALWYTPLDTLGGSPSPSLALPADIMDYQVTVDSTVATPSSMPQAASAASEPVTIARFGPGYSLRVDASAPAQGTSDVFTIAADGSSLRYEPGSTTGSADLSIGSGAAGESYRVTVEGLSAAPGQPVLLTSASGQYKLDYSQAQTGAYTLQIEHVTGGQVENFLHQHIPILAGSVHYLNIAAWTPGQALSVDVDANADGTLDGELTLQNTFYKIYLPVSVKQ
jgi:hypothetical protein